MAHPKKRLDTVLVERGLFPSTDAAMRACLEGKVMSGSQVLSKAGMQVAEDIELQIKGSKRFVSRGGEKLFGALRDLSFDVSGMHCVDIGASTGGFTDCLLQAGASSVAAVDVGYGLLAWSLQTDPRVQVFDRTNIKNVDPATIGAPFDLAVADLSFIGLARVLQMIHDLLAESGWFLGLVKPQFEARKEDVQEGGIIRKESVQIEAIERVIEASIAADMPATQLCFSSLPGQEGNIEFFLLMQRGGSPAQLDVASVVHDAHLRYGGISCES